MPVVVGLARGGVPVAFEVSRALGAPLDVVVMRKLVVPDAPDRPIGAPAEGGGVCLDPETVGLLGIPRDVIDAVAERKAAELQRTVERYRARRPPIDVAGRTADSQRMNCAGAGVEPQARCALKTVAAGESPPQA